MLPLYDAFNLSWWIGVDDPIFLVPSVRWLSLSIEGGYREVDTREALLALDDVAHLRWEELRHFVAQVRLDSLAVNRMDDQAVLASVREAIRSRRVVAIHKATEPPSSSATVELRRLVAQVEKATRSKLAHRGRQYKLVADVDLAKMPGRDGYEVASQAEAQVVLATAAKNSPASADLLRQAATKLSKDWHPPGGPEGIVLMRRILVQAAAPKDTGPAITPSQMEALLDADKRVAFFARFVDDYGKPIEGFAGGLRHDDDELDMSFSGSALAQVAGLKGSTSASLTVSDDDLRLFTDALKKRWKEIRGDRDDAWRAKEEALAEVLLRKGSLPVLSLEAEKKHTFMVRPRVALCRLRGLYFETDRCFLLPAAVPSLKRLVEIAASYPESEVLIVGHTDTAGSEAYNLELSGQRAEVMKAYLCDDADAWLGYYDASVAEAKRWGDDEDAMMLDAVVSDADLAGAAHVRAYQAWHNGESPDARTLDQERTRPKGWEALQEDGVLGPKTRRQLILDYMNLDGTSLAEGTRIVTYACGEYFPLAEEEGEVDAEASDNEHVAFDRRVEILFFDKPFGILPPVPGVAEGESSTKPTNAPKGDKLYPEWCLRANRHHVVEAEGSELRLRLCDLAMEPYAERPFLFSVEGSSEVRGTTDADGYLSIEAPRRGGNGYVEVWPDDDPEYKLRWDIDIGIHLSPVTPLGAAHRLRNLDYYKGELTADMTEELREAVTAFQADRDGMEARGDLDLDTAEALGQLHADAAAQSQSADSEGDGP